jgi:hypothetical protein
MSTNDELIQKGKIYRDFIKSPGWKLLCQDMMVIVNSHQKVVMTDFKDLRNKEKGIRLGILEMIAKPSEAIEEMEEILTEQEDA